MVDHVYIFFAAEGVRLTRERVMGANEGHSEIDFVQRSAVIERTGTNSALADALILELRFVVWARLRALHCCRLRKITHRGRTARE